MPEGIFLMRWDPRLGPEILGMHPPEAVITRDELVNIFGSLLLREEERREGFYSYQTLSEPRLNVVAYYSGEELNQLFGIILREDEDMEAYRGGLVRVAIRMFKLGEIAIETEEKWSEIWQWIINYPTMTLEQRLGDIFQEAEARRLLDIMVERGISTIDDVVLAMKSEFPVLSRDVIVTYVHSLEALNIFATKWDEKALIERVYLLRDVLFHRKRPEKYNDITKEIRTYTSKWETFAQRYYNEGWMNDKNVLPEILGNPEKYRVILEFRKRGVIHENEVNAVGWSDIVEDLRYLEIIDKEDEYYYLFSDPTVAYVFPRYTISSVVEKLRDGTFSKDLVMEYLRMLRDSYMRT